MRVSENNFVTHKHVYLQYNPNPNPPPPQAHTLPHTLVKAAAVICTLPSSEAYTLRSWRYVLWSRRNPEPGREAYSPSPPGYMHRNALPSSSACFCPAGVSSPPHLRMRRRTVSEGGEGTMEVVKSYHTLLSENDTSGLTITGSSRPCRGRLSSLRGVYTYSALQQYVQSRLQTKIIVFPVCYK